MALKKIKLSSEDCIFISDGNRNGFGCGTINDDGHLYLIDEYNQEAFLLPDRYANTPFSSHPSCGGYRDGLIMVSLLGELDLQYQKWWRFCAFKANDSALITCDLWAPGSQNQPNPPPNRGPCLWPFSQGCTSVA